MTQIIRELKRQAAGEKLPEQLKGLIRAATSNATVMSTSSPTKAATLWLSSASSRGIAHWRTTIRH
jgi:hypothetical protein